MEHQQQRKSYKDASQISIDQFKSYIGSITSLSELKYVFNSIKLTPAQAKEGMKALLKNKKQSIYDSMKSDLKTNLSLRSVTDLTDSKIEEMVNIFVDSK